MARVFSRLKGKRISADVSAMLAQPKYRLGLVRMIEDGVYGFGVPREASIPKDSGGKRLVYILPDLDRCTMSVITKVYFRLYGGRIHPCCKSYQEGLSVPATLHHVMGSISFSGYKVDISKYFDSVPRWKINSMLESMDTGSPVDKMFWDFYNTDLIIRDGMYVPHFKSLGQGCAFASLLANLWLAVVDEELSAMCTVYIRYSDDILMLGPEADKALEVLKARLSAAGLELHPAKVERIAEDTEFTFLGGRISRGRVRMSKKTRDKLKKEVRKIVEKYRRRGDRNAQKKIVNRLKKFFLGKSQGYCLLQYYCFLCTDAADIRFLDDYCRDEIKAAYTGRHNHAENEHKTSNDEIRSMGWVSFVHLWKLFKMSPDVFKAKVNALQEREIDPKSVVETEKIYLMQDTHTNLVSGLVKQGGVNYRVARKERACAFQRIEELWPKARLYQGKTALNVSPDFSAVYSPDEMVQIELAIKEVELLIVTTRWHPDRYFLQSAVWPDLIIFKEWTELSGQNWR